MSENPSSVPTRPFALERVVRLGIPAPGERVRAAAAPKSNPAASWPPVDGLGIVLELAVEVVGTPGVPSGYVVSITDIDRVVRERAFPIVAEAFDRAWAGAAEPTGDLLARVGAAIAEGLRPHQVRRVRWSLSPYRALRWNPAMPAEAELSIECEFAASHRLHCPELDAERNRELFGKCNHPSGHGHNYRLEVAVRIPLGGPPPFRPSDLERVVDETVVRRFDHRHLNIDCPEFAALNPSVEHIARVCHDLLEDPVRSLGGSLGHVRVWETGKTSCRYPASA